tara:strand:+ start:8882 stop:9256 length:375 start_codon:yes stop_codon:yes gene_type:complete
MKLIQQYIQKNLDLSEELFLHANYLKGVWKFYVAYNISCSYLGIEGDKKKNKLWKQLILNPKLNLQNSTKLERIRRLIIEDSKVIVRAMEQIQDDMDSSNYDVGDIDGEGVIGIINYEYPRKEI